MLVAQGCGTSLEDIMATMFKQIAPPALLALAALVVGPLAIGCMGQVEVNDGDGEASDDLSATACTPEEAEVGNLRNCTLSDGVTSGTQTCVFNEKGDSVWSNCSASTSTFSTPLVLSFDRAPVEFTASASSFGFDLTGSMSVATDWPTAKTPWLALDRNGNGQIDDGGELFGSATVLQDGARATNGFVALRELDANNDGQITDADAAWSRLLLWSDGDGDRLSTARELSAASSHKLLSIDLGYSTRGATCDPRGNCAIERATFRYLDDAGVERTGDIIDVHLKFQ
jgi:hypothetical protein